MRTRWVSILIAGLVFVPAAPAAAAPVAPAGRGTPTAAAWDEVFDGFTPTAPGGVVASVVSGDRTAFTKGYGSLDPQRSLVRIASITKLFTWTAVMQQVEAGRLDLNADVNDYLTAFKVPATYPRPVTLLTLMNHTAGFESRTMLTAARTAADVSPLAEYLADNMPARIRPPGEVSAYSNYGAALAGYIVTKVSGEPWDRYVQLHLLDPLGMTHSTAAEPVPAPLAADLAASYDTDVTPARRAPFDFDQLAPDGSISATAADMARFMSAQLNQGRKILAPATAALMHERTFAADPRLGGYAHGFQDRTVNGHRVLMHDGGWEDFVSLLVLVPDCHLGIFLSVNTTGDAAALQKLIPRLYDKFIPKVAPVAVPAAPTGAPVAGFYQPARHNESSVEKLNTLTGQLRLTVDGDGTVHFKGKEWTAQGDGLYRSADGLDHLAFLPGEVVATDGPEYQRMGPAEALPADLAMLLAIVVLALSALAVPLGRLRRRKATTTNRWRTSRALAAAASALGLTFVILLLVVLLGDTTAFLYAIPLSFRLLLILPLVVLATAASAVAFTVRSWRGSGAGVVARIHQIALIAGLATFGWFVVQWNLIGWQLG